MLAIFATNLTFALWKEVFHIVLCVFVQDWDKPEYIADPDATQPEDWDEDMDGEWEPPMIPNPDYNGA